MNASDELVALKLIEGGVLPALAKEVISYREAFLAAKFPPSMADRLTEQMHDYLCWAILPQRWTSESD